MMTTFADKVVKDLQITNVEMKMMIRRTASTFRLPACS